MKKILSFLLALLILASFLMLFGCEIKKNNDNNSNSTEATQPTVSDTADDLETGTQQPFEYVAPDVDNSEFSVTLANYVTFGAQRFINTYCFEDKYYVFIPADFDMSDTMLYFNIPKNYSIKIDGKSIQSGFMTFDFTQNKVYTLYVGLRGGTYSNYELVGIQSKAPTMYLDIDESLGTFEAMNTDLTKKTFAYGLCYMDSTNNAHDFISYFDIHGHGNSTWKTERLDKPYNLRFKEDDTYTDGRKIGLMGMTPASKWNLISDTGEVTKSKNRIALYIAEQLEMDYVVELNYANLFINGEFIGIYQVTEKPVNVEDELGLTLAESDNMNGSWIFEFDNHSGQEHQFYVKNLKVTVKSTIDNCKYTALQKHLTSVNVAMLNKDGVNKSTGKSISDYLDLESFAKLLLVRDFTMDYDTVVNYWAYYDHSDGKIHAGPVWDFNNSMGQTTKELYHQHDQLLVLSDTKGPGCWLVELMKFKEFTDILKEVYTKYSYVFDGQSQDSALAVWESYYEYYKDVSNMHRARWNQDTGTGSLNGFEIESTRLARYFAKCTYFLYNRSKHFGNLIMGL